MRKDGIGREGRTYLRVKVKSLDEEIRIIRKEQKRVKKSWDYLGKKAEQAESESEEQKEFYYQARLLWYNKTSLKDHMVQVVKPELRSALLALAFCNGKPYSRIERYTRNQPDWRRVETLAKRYGRMNFFHDYHRKIDEAWDEWYREALTHIYLTGGGVEWRREKEALEGRALREEQLTNNPNHVLKTSYSGEVRLYPSDPRPLVSTKAPEPEKPERKKFLGMF